MYCQHLQIITLDFDSKDLLLTKQLDALQHSDVHCSLVHISFNYYVLEQFAVQLVRFAIALREYRRCPLVVVQHSDLTEANWRLHLLRELYLR